MEKPIKTPPLPVWIREYSTRSYTNIYELCPQETRLYGTESLYGDWDGPLLLLAKDFAPSRLVRERLNCEERPYHHTDWKTEPGEIGATTNRNLSHFAERIPCGKLYGSALAGLLRKDGRISGPLPDLDKNMPFIRKVLEFTIGHMPNLRVLACLGEVAWHCTTLALQCADADWSEHRQSRLPVEVGELRLFALAHPSRYPPGGKARVQGDWDALRAYLPV